jgi:alpha-amylase/alpha-mannosidase (GH57 family)
MNILGLLIFLTGVAASFTNCANNRYALPISELFVDPPAIVAANQPVNMRIAFEIPQYTYVPHGLVEIAISWNGLALTTVRQDLSNYFTMPMFAGHHVFERSTFFPADIWGRVDSTINVFNSSGSQLFCAQWIVFATGTDKNETSWPWSALYTA